MFKRKKTDAVIESSVQGSANAPTGASSKPSILSKPVSNDGIRSGIAARLKSALARTRTALTGSIAALLKGRTKLDEALVEEIETLLLSADTGVDATQRMITGLRTRVGRSGLDAKSAMGSLRADMLSILSAVATPLVVPATLERPFVILVVGVNGSGKTTTIAKLCHQLRAQERKVLLAAGDTFRAAATEQLQIWGERNHTPVIAQHSGADSASVIFDACQAATARGIEVLIADTAGRLHTNTGLMDELKKINRVIGKWDAQAPQEVLLTLDAGTGQNAVAQTRQFHEAIGITGIVLTKMDGTAKGGIVFALAEKFGIPIRFIGCGESSGDLKPFVAEVFVDALLSHDSSDRA